MDDIEQALAELQDNLDDLRKALSRFNPSIESLFGKDADHLGIVQMIQIAKLLIAAKKSK